MRNYTRIPAPRVTLVNTQTGIVADEWFRFFNNLYTIAYAATGNVTAGTYGSAIAVPQITVDDFGAITGVVNVSIAIDANQIVSGALLIARGGTGLSTLPTNGQLLIGNAINGYVLNTLTPASGINITNAPGAITITNTGVLSFSAGTTGLTPSTTTTGAVTLAGTLGLANGGTGGTDAATARTNLGVTATGADTTYAFRANNLSDLASAATARTNLGLGTIAVKNTGATGSFTTVDSKTVTVTDGIITSIV